MHPLTLDLRFVFRSLARQPLFTFLSIFTLALGLGANTVIFSVVDAVLFRPLPFADPERLVRVWPETYFSKHDFLAFHEQAGSYDGLAAYFSWGVYGLSGGDTPEVVRAAQVSSEFFSALGVPATVGRAFVPDQNRDGFERLAVLSHRLHQRLFGADSDVVGRQILLDGVAYTVTGVMPETFRFPIQDTELWIPMRFDPRDEVDFTAGYVQLIGRLKPGTTAASAQAEGEAIAASLREAFGYADDFGSRKTVADLQQTLVGDVRPAMLTLLVAVGLVLLIAAANVANLLLTRAAGRSREVAVRAALGAERSRIVRLLLTESLVLALMGGALGLLATVLGFEALVRLLPSEVPRLHEIILDGRLFGFALALALVTGVLFGLAPAVQTARRDLFEGLRGGAGAPGRSRLSGGLVVAEVALALVLVVGAGLLIKSFWRLTQVEPGFEPQRVLSFYPVLPQAYDFEREKAFYEQALDRLAAQPGVESAGAVHMLPVASWGFNGGLETEDHPVEAGTSPPVVNWRVVTPDYFATLGIPLLRGRGLAAGDRAGSPEVALINQSLANRFWPDKNPVGKRLRHSLDGGKEVTVVGVVGDVRQHGLGNAVAPEVYRPSSQNERPVGMTFVARAAGSPEPLFAAAREAVRQVDPAVPLTGFRTMHEVLHSSLGDRRLVMRLVGLFGAVALLLGAIGIYGVMAHDVGRRTRELGLRVALGAQRRDVFGLVLRRGMALVAAGMGLGLLAALGLARFLASQLFEVRPIDVGLYSAVVLLLAVVAMAATYLPARRATTIDPLAALRDE